MHFSIWAEVLSFPWLQAVSLSLRPLNRITGLSILLLSTFMYIQTLKWWSYKEISDKSLVYFMWNWLVKKLDVLPKQCNASDFLSLSATQPSAMKYLNQPASFPLHIWWLWDLLHHEFCLSFTLYQFPLLQLLMALWLDPPSSPSMFLRNVWALSYSCGQLALKHWKLPRSADSHNATRHHNNSPAVC